MIELGVSYFSGLPTLVGDPEVSLQYIKVGDWLGQPASEIMDLLPDKTFLYHQASLVRTGEADTQALIANMQDWQHQTDCPWLSAHIDCHTDEETHALVYESRRPRRRSTGQMFEMICHAVQTVQAHLPVPLLLENMPHWSLPELDAVALPGFIRRVLDKTQCALLVDTAHARVSAAALGCCAQRYLEDLPLGRVVEIHVSGPRRDSGGRWTDCHEPLQDEDYALLEWLLQQVTPRVVTLEYWRDATQVREQILRLNQLIGRFNKA